LNYEERPGPIVGEGAAVGWLGLLLNLQLYTAIKPGRFQPQVQQNQ